MLCVWCAFAAYIEGIDTTDVNGYGRDSTFYVINGRIGGQNIIHYWFRTFVCRGYYNYSFDDIKMAPSQPMQSELPPQGTVYYCFVVKSNKDSTYSKVQLLQQVSGNRYVYKYGTNTTPNNRMLIKIDYDRSIRYKPNALFNYLGGQYPNNWDTVSWEPPLPNDNHLLGYIFYQPKTGVIMDTTAPINPVQWDSIAFFTSTNINFMPVLPMGKYFNLVTVYSEGKSDFLAGWTKMGYPPIGIKGNPLVPCLLQSELHIIKTCSGFFISFPQSRKNTAPSSLSIFNVTGARLAQFSNIKGNRVLWKTDNLAEGVYLVRAELQDGSAINRQLVFTR